MAHQKRPPEREEKITEFFQLLGDTLHFLRLKRGLSIRRLSESTHMSREVISRLEKGIHREVRTATLGKLCDFYDLTVREFFSFADEIRKATEEEEQPGKD
jgi:transcriptional regulator with XRE-family HTH domain